MSDVDRRFPLHWPEGWPRAERPVRNNHFAMTEGRARSVMLDELQRLGATGIIISTNIKLRLDGLPYANQPVPVDAGVAVYFKVKGEERCIPCDRWNLVGDNYRAIGLTVAALRGLDRWGTHKIVEAAFRGFKALPAGDGPSSLAAALRTVETTARIQSGALLESGRLSAFESAVRMGIKAVHPDIVGDDGAALRRLIAARDFIVANQEWAS